MQGSGTKLDRHEQSFERCRAWQSCSSHGEENLARADPPFTTKVIQDQEPEELTEEWRAGARRWLEGVKKIRLDKRIYEDETPVFANEAPKRGRARRGTPILRARSRYAKKYTLHVYAKRSGVRHWDLSDKNADTKEIERVAIDAVER